MGVNKTDCGNRFIITVKCYVTTKFVRPNHVNHTQLRVCVCVCAQLCTTLCDSMDCSSSGSSVHEILQARILEWVAMLYLQGIFLTQGSNPGLLHFRQILYCLSHHRSPPGSGLRGSPSNPIRCHVSAACVLA